MAANAVLESPTLLQFSAEHVALTFTPLSSLGPTPHQIAIFPDFRGALLHHVQPFCALRGRIILDSSYSLVTYLLVLRLNHPL